MAVLVACEESQAITIAFRNEGIEAYSCDIQDCSGGYPEWHIKGDVRDIIHDNWDLIIAHPPCTYLSNVTARWLFPGGKLNIERYKLGLAAKDFFMIFYNLDCAHVCIENPIPLKIFGLPDYSQIIEPYHFGHPFSKATCLWLKGLPPLFATTYSCLDIKSFTNFTYHDSLHRSKTFPGIAAAMASQWKSYCK